MVLLTCLKAIRYNTVIPVSVAPIYYELMYHGAEKMKHQIIYKILTEYDVNR